MAKKEPEVVALQRPEKPRRKRRWWLLILVVALLIIAAGLIYVFQFRIAETFQAVPTLPPTPPGASTPGVLYYTDFENPAVTADWDIFKDGFISSAIKDGRLVVDVNALTDTPAWSGLHYTFADFALDVDATKLAGPDDNGIIVIFRLADDKNYNRFDISSDGYYSLSKVREGVPTVISDWNLSPAIKTGETPNHIRLTAVGDTFRFEVNGTPMALCSATDPAAQPLWDPANPGQCLGGVVADAWQNGDLPQGRIGLGAQGIVGFDGQDTTPALATIGFDNLVIKAP